MRGLVTWWFATPVAPTERPLLFVDAERRGPVVNTAVLSNVAAGYAPAGQHLVQCSAVLTGPVPSEEQVRQHASAIFDAPTDDWRVLAVHELPNSLPVMPPGMQPRRSTWAAACSSRATMWRARRSRARCCPDDAPPRRCWLPEIEEHGMRGDAMEALDVLIGSWQVAMRNAWFLEPPDREDAGSAQIEWLGDAFVIFRWTVRGDTGTPSETAIAMGRSDSNDRYVALYHDERGISRIFAMTFDGALWTLSREDADMFQRFSAEVSPDRIAGKWEASDDRGETWRKDFDLSSSESPVEPVGWLSLSKPPAGSRQARVSTGSTSRPHARNWRWWRGLVPSRGWVWPPRSATRLASGPASPLRPPTTSKGLDELGSRHLTIHKGLEELGLDRLDQPIPRKELEVVEGSSRVVDGSGRRGACDRGWLARASPLRHRPSTRCRRAGSRQARPADPTQGTGGGGGGSSRVVDGSGRRGSLRPRLVGSGEPPPPPTTSKGLDEPGLDKLDQPAGAQTSARWKF